MNNTELKQAHDKYAADWASDKITCAEIINADLSPEDATQVIGALTNGLPEDKTAPTGTGIAPVVAEKNTEAPVTKKTNYAVFDEFETRIQKKEVRNVMANRNDTIITGWELGKKLHSKKIEKHNAKYLNSFANGANPNENFPMLVPVDTMRNGDMIKYADWAKEQGIDPTQDINILLNPQTV